MDGATHIKPLFSEGEQYLQKPDLPEFYALTGGLYVRRRQLLENWSGRDFCLGADRRAIEVDAQETLNIDPPLDLDLFRVLIEQHQTRTESETS